MLNWGLRPSNRNSVLALLKQRRFEVIQSAMALRAVCKREIFSLNLVGWKDMNNWVSSAYTGIGSPFHSRYEARKLEADLGSWAVSPQVTGAINPPVGQAVITLRPAGSYLPGCGASPPHGRHQIILLGDRGTMWL